MDEDRNPFRGIFWGTMITSVVVIIGVFAVEARWEVKHLGILAAPTLGGVFGDLIGGFLGPILSLVGIYFVVLTLHEQQKATRHQQQATRDERQAERLQGFESRYYQLLTLHRDNVAEMEIGEGDKAIKGRGVFIHMLLEIQEALEIIEEVDRDETLLLSFQEQLQIAYYAMFFGVGGESLSFFAALASAGKVFSEDRFVKIEEKLLRRGAEHKPPFFEGRQSLLGHYYRHLFQTISFIDIQGEKVDGKSFAKTVRAQLSTHEQLMLLVNSLTGIGWDWWDAGYMKKYAMVKNLSYGFAEEYCKIDTRALFPGESYFEWEQYPSSPEIVSRLKRFGVL